MKRVAVVGYGNIGRYAVQAVEAAPDLELAGVVRRQVAGALPPELREVQVVDDIQKLGRVDAALLCVPSRTVPDKAREVLELGINTVDSFDIHGEDLLRYRKEIDITAKEHGAVAVIAAGWDPGTDSVVRALLELMAPKGITFTNFGPGMSMGHSVAAKAVPGVKDALSMTIPAGAGRHRRQVYVELEPGADFQTVEANILADPYFNKDETFVYQVSCIKDLQDVGHGVLMERVGTSGRTANQQFKWEMRINNPALTAQIMTAAARASFRRQPGAYTLLEIPLIDCFSDDLDELVMRLV
ncbi:MAG: diaminopimelate dehydrogenase [Limnochordia bacterium]|jgi:diaminopimelate dehydrogenase|nr:diaminopimelate dehydrogenase [Limnochordia bacterium]NLO94963.1 diaminopimelate dehydrogenase [Bacillota bacterium]HOB39535.1 diaminopimelate dehydrogenase [Limnochordia bacterium]HOK30559.1 diaminopimelate dehydrogenase [Limnochordia bacterium]HOL99364.1 diaminopimelate dehydrogenase [Limnochordia bacterium]